MWHARFGSGRKDMPGAVHIDPAQQFTIRIWLNEPGQMNDHITAGKYCDKIVLRLWELDIHAVPISLIIGGQASAGYPPGNPDNAVYILMFCQFTQHRCSGVTGGADYRYFHRTYSRNVSMGYPRCEMSPVKHVRSCLNKI